MRAVRGFTLIELLVAMTLLAILSVLGYRAFGALLLARERLMQTSQQWVDVARAFRRLEGDLSAQTPQPNSGEIAGGWGLGASGLSLQNMAQGQLLILRNVSASYASGEEEIRYQQSAQGLTWSAAEVGATAKPVAYPLLSNVVRVQWRVWLGGERWSETWPPAQADGAGQRARALEMRVHLPGNELARRVWVLP
ncbi:prepilin-type N-terminal cleavage/methylation domain-containing protein [Neisseriaceae bacterium TC5R-5]|nr:prepilin-type N-terminal cleavage/methylation domain-containing protein [Neisseriaceae bacterium TC5R-5]